MSPLVLFLQASLAQSEMTVVVRHYDATHRSLDLMSWWLNKEIYYEAPGTLQLPSAYYPTVSDDELFERLKWSVHQPRSDEKEQLRRYLEALNASSFYFKPETETSSLAYRLVQPSSEPDCDINNCSTIEIFPVSQGPSPLDVPLGLADGLVEWADVERAYLRTTGRLLTVKMNRHIFPPEMEISGNPTLRNYLYEACQKSCGWSFAARITPSGRHNDLLMVRARGSAWFSGKEAAQDSYRKESGHLLPKSFDPVPVSTPPPGVLP